MAVSIPLIGKVIEKVTGIVDQVVEDKDLSRKLILTLQRELLNRLGDTLEKELTERARIISAEAVGHSWLQRNWRPITMLVFVYIIAHNHIIAPLFSAPSLPIPPDMWELLKLGIGGYLIGRSAEKIFAGTGKEILRLMRGR